MKQLAALAVALALMAIALPAQARTDTQFEIRIDRTRHHIVELRWATWHAQDARHARRSETFHLERRVQSLPRLHRLAHYWFRRRVAARRALAQYRAAQDVARQPVRVAESGDSWAWECIHSKEGSWDDDGAPYYGGLQMDISFQQTYGAEYLRRWGTANNWPVWAQIDAARRARDSGRGYYPWPNTARACGLI